MTETDSHTDATAPTVTERLLDAAETLLATKGIRATTMLQVAEEAGVSRAWLYRHFPDKQALLGAAIVRLNDEYWARSHRELDEVEHFEEQLAAGVRLGRSAYDSPGALVMRLRMTEPEEFAACAGAGVQGLVPDLALFWLPYVTAARERGEIDATGDDTEVSEWIARILISLATVPGHTLDPDDPVAVLRHLRRFVMPGLRGDA
ncbi:TetR/AcrR family transcriptional regulator [Aldersonia kunmingensis]|uniref:TetR/AcrR family transcriptional regulator n=1 Tax=Aldersonia kunmingensis TaxID=408066 RepID=UPI00082BB226|nr:TetR/AcrR family transcriptional regulator [Aldersonia kunmingensis]